MILSTPAVIATPSRAQWQEATARQEGPYATALRGLRILGPTPSVRERIGGNRGLRWSARRGCSAGQMMAGFSVVVRGASAVHGPAAPPARPRDPRPALAPTALSLTLQAPFECQCEAERDHEQPVGWAVYDELDRCQNRREDQAGADCCEPGSCVLLIIVAVAHAGRASSRPGSQPPGGWLAQMPAWFGKRRAAAGGYASPPEPIRRIHRRRLQALRPPCPNPLTSGSGRRMRPQRGATHR